MPRDHPDRQCSVRHEKAPMTENFRPDTLEQVADAVKWAVAGKQPLDVVAGATKSAIGRSVEIANRLDMRFVLRHFALRAGGTGVDGRRGDADAQDRKGAGQEEPATGLRAGKSRAAAGRAGKAVRAQRRHARRHRRVQSRGPPADPVRSGPRQSSRFPRGQRPGRAVQVGRPGDQERNRFRPVEADRRLVRNPGGDDRGQRPRSADARGNPDGSGARMRGRRRLPRPDPGPPDALRGVRRGASAGQRGGSFQNLARRDRGRRGHRHPHRGAGALGGVPVRRASAICWRPSG